MNRQLKKGIILVVVLFVLINTLTIVLLATKLHYFSIMITYALSIIASVVGFLMVITSHKRFYGWVTLATALSCLIFWTVILYSDRGIFI